MTETFYVFVVAFCGGGEQMGAIFPGATRDPWAVLLAALMLQRTRADLVLPIYVAAMERYPTAARFAAADPAELEVILRPLGFHHRNARLQKAARACADGVPQTMTGC